MNKLIDNFMGESKEYNKSWDALMPVVQRIWEMIHLTHKEYLLEKNKYGLCYKNGLLHHAMYGGLEQCSWAVEDFIKWYNEKENKNLP